VLDPFIGIYNINQNIINRVSLALRESLDTFTVNTTTTGPVLIAYTDLTVVQDSLLKDKLNVTVNISVPYALNNIAVRLIV
jgi:hypothetical protein